MTNGLPLRTLYNKVICRLRVFGWGGGVGIIQFGADMVSKSQDTPPDKSVPQSSPYSESKQFHVYTPSAARGRPSQVSKILSPYDRPKALYINNLSNLARGRGIECSIR